MQTIIGAGGAVGQQLAKELSQFTDSIRLVSRNPKKVNEQDELFPADATDAVQLEKAVQGSEVVYLTIGFEYNINIWKQNWPPLMKNLIDACKKHNAKLVFFDNVYMYDREHLNPMTEETPVRPTSRKGHVRAHIANMLMSEVEKGDLTALIARAADFIGPVNSLVTELVCKNLLKGKKATWFADVKKLHNFTHTSDAAKGTAILGNTPDAFNQVWHLPTDTTPLTAKEWIELFAKEIGTRPKYMVMPVWMMGFFGLLMPVIKEFKEMSYQYDRDYVFDSTKFETKFDYKPLIPEEAVKQTVREVRGS